MNKMVMLVIVAVALAVATSCRQNDTGKEDSVMVPEPSAKVMQFLGGVMIDILKNPEKVESYRVGFHKTGKGNNMGGYPVTGKGRDLAPKQVERLQAMLFDENTYLFDVVKKCLFLPEYAFRFLKGGKSVIVLICYSCEELTFVFEGKELLEDFNNATPRMRILTSELF